MRLEFRKEFVVIIVSWCGFDVSNYTVKSYLDIWPISVLLYHTILKFCSTCVCSIYVGHVTDTGHWL